MTLQEIKEVKSEILWDVTAKKNFKLQTISSTDELDWGKEAKKDGYFFYILVEKSIPRLIFAKIENDSCENICIIDMTEEVLEQALGESSSSSQINGVFPYGGILQQVLKGEIK